MDLSNRAGASSDHGANKQGSEDQDAMLSTLSRALSGEKGQGVGEGPLKDGTDGCNSVHGKISQFGLCNGMSGS